MKMRNAANAALLAIVGYAAGAHAAAPPELIPMWNASDESNTETIDHLLTPGPWEMELITIQGEKLTLDNVEHGILRPIWKDPRIHYAVNCASIGCPNISLEAFRADNLERLLEKGARDYVNHPRGMQIVDDELVVSSIYDRFKVDFGDTDEGVFAHLRQYATPERAKMLEGRDDFDDHYDWKLNAPDS